MKIDVLTISEEDVECRITGFANFGNKMADLKDRYMKAKFPDADVEEEDEGEEAFDASQYLDLARERLKGLPGADEMLKMINTMEQGFADDDDKDDAEDSDSDPDIYTVTFGLDERWSDEQVGKLKSFLTQWPSLREQILDAAFDYYRSKYGDIWALWGGEDADRIYLPEPTCREVIEDLFRISSFHLLDEEGAFGVSGNCTWDQEHGFGVRFEGGRIVEFGYADVCY